MASILQAVSNYFDRELCASDDCIVPGDDDSPSVAPLIDIAIGKFQTTCIPVLVVTHCVPPNLHVPMTLFSYSHYFCT